MWFIRSKKTFTVAGLVVAGLGGGALWSATNGEAPGASSPPSSLSKSKGQRSSANAKGRRSGEQKPSGQRTGTPADSAPKTKTVQQSRPSEEQPPSRDLRQTLERLRQKKTISPDRVLRVLESSATAARKLAFLETLVERIDSPKPLHPKRRWVRALLDALLNSRSEGDLAYKAAGLLGHMDLGGALAKRVDQAVRRKWDRLDTRQKQAATNATIDAKFLNGVASDRKEPPAARHEALHRLAGLGERQPLRDFAKNTDHPPALRREAVYGLVRTARSPEELRQWMDEQPRDDLDTRRGRAQARDRLHAAVATSRAGKGPTVLYELWRENLQGIDRKSMTDVLVLAQTLAESLWMNPEDRETRRMILERVRNLLSHEPGSRALTRLQGRAHLELAVSIVEACGRSKRCQSEEAKPVARIEERLRTLLASPDVPGAKILRGRLTH